MENTTREQIANAYDAVKTCAISEWEISQEEVAIKQRKIASHKLTQLAKQALADLEF